MDSDALESQFTTMLDTTQSQWKTIIDTSQTHWKTLQATFQNEHTHLNQEKESFKREQEEYESMKKKVSSVNYPSSIKLDVGGKRFRTSLSTLKKEDSMLSRMFEDGIPFHKDEDGFYFIDRPGTYFEPILDYLQTGKFVQPLDSYALEKIKMEAEFYQIESLVDLLHHRRKTFDNRGVGIIEWIATDQGKSKYKNPLKSEKVSIECSNPNIKPETTKSIVGRDLDDDVGGCDDKDNTDFEIDLKEIRVCPTSYSLSHQTCNAPMNWKIEASCPGKEGAEEWVMLKEHVQDESLVGEDTRVNWPVESGGKWFSKFRITRTGPSEASWTCWHLHAFELFGEVKY